MLLFVVSVCGWLKAFYIPRSNHPYIILILDFKNLKTP
jgi:hypothetical protein